MLCLMCWLSLFQLLLCWWLSLCPFVVMCTIVAPLQLFHYTGVRRETQSAYLAILEILLMKYDTIRPYLWFRIWNASIFMFVISFCIDINIFQKVWSMHNNDVQRIFALHKNICWRSVTIWYWNKRHLCAYNNIGSKYIQVYDENSMIYQK